MAFNNFYFLDFFINNNIILIVIFLILNLLRLFGSYILILRTIFRLSLFTGLF